MAQCKRQSTDENNAPKLQLAQFKQHQDVRKDRIFGREISNILQQQQPVFLQNILQLKKQRPISVQRHQSLNPQNRRCNVSQDEISNNQSILVAPSLLPIQTTQDEIFLEQPNIQMVNPYLDEIFSYLLEKEKPTDSQQSLQSEINPKMRAILIDWLIDVHLRFKLQPETIFLTVTLVDQYLKGPQVSRSKLQLLGISALFIASKYCEIYPPQLTYFSDVTDKTYSKGEILEMEGKILNELQFNLTFASPLAFYERFSHLIKLEERCYWLGRYLLELALIDSKFQKYKPSMQACSAIYLTQKIYRKKTSWTQLLETNTGNSEQMVRPCAKELCQMLQQAQSITLRAAQRKYSSSQFMEVSKIHIQYKGQNESRGLR